MTNTVELNQTEAEILKALLAKASLNGTHNGKPIELTVKGSEDVVVPQASSYQQLLDEIEEAETIAAINEGLADIEAGRTRPAREVMEELCREFGLSEPRVNLR